MSVTWFRLGAEWVALPACTHRERLIHNSMLMAYSCAPGGTRAFSQRIWLSCDQQLCYQKCTGSQQRGGQCKAQLWTLPHLL